MTMNYEIKHEQREGYVFATVYDKGVHVASVWKIFNFMLIEFHIGERRKVILKNIDFPKVINWLANRRGGAHGKH